MIWAIILGGNSTLKISDPGIGKLFTFQFPNINEKNLSLVLAGL